MKILILGAGQVGRTAAQALSREEANEVTVVDTDEDIPRDLQGRIDVCTVAGNASYPAILEAAGADTDILVALTSSDGQHGGLRDSQRPYRTPTRSRDPRLEYTSQDGCLRLAHWPWMCDQPGTAGHRIYRAPDPASRRAADRGFRRWQGAVGGNAGAQGRPAGGPAAAQLRDHMPNRRIAAIYRKGRFVPLDGETAIEEGDEIFFVAARDNITRMMGEITRAEERAQGADRRRRQHRFRAGADIGEAVPGQTHRARRAARGALPSVSKPPSCCTATPRTRNC
jgi:trk system potassium uptake protein TrkA